ncbi:MAG: 3-dehydroquinate synthase [Candidatus Omnitrophota bacterium]|nr:3-dehydroquinate synthase [Candidatus Omnitrophota bacterium]
MAEIKVELAENSYPIIIGSKILAGFSSVLKKEKLDVGGRVALVTNPVVERLPWFKGFYDRLAHSGFKVNLAIVPSGREYKRHPDLERFKSNKMVMRLYDEFLKNKLDRTSLVIAVGGGTTGDLAGFAASTYMRGINLVHIPTTLVGQVDSSIGGKTAINLPRAKNLAGTFYQPKLVYADIDLLKTLPPRELRCGFSEVVKYGVIEDRPLFDYLEKDVQAVRDIIAVKSWSRHGRFLLNVITRCCRIKAEVVKQDELETKGLREILNYGHTVGHGLETAGRYKKLHHGEAVSIGMVAAGRIAESIGLLKKRDLLRQIGLLEAIGLPTTIGSLNIGRITKAIMLDKKSRGKTLRFILPRAIGRVIVSDKVSVKLIEKVLRQMR